MNTEIHINAQFTTYPGYRIQNLFVIYNAKVAKFVDILYILFYKIYTKSITN